jgi:hypothetical protein
LFGLVGWLVTSFFAKPLIDFYDLRRKVREEMLYTANIGAMHLQQESHKAEFDEAFHVLRRLGARILAMDIDPKWPLQLFLKRRGYNLAEAGGGLIGLANSLEKQHGEKALQKTSVQKGLKLPRDYTDQDIQNIINRINRGE